MHNRRLAKPENARKTPVEQREADRLEAPAKNQGRLVDPDQASGGGAHPGLGHVQSSHPQQAARLRCGPPEG
jgi:hypothetical protein